MESHEDQYILVSAPTKAGEEFIRTLLIKKLPFAVLINNLKEKQRLDKLGIQHFIKVDTRKHSSWVIPEFPVGSVYLFENSLPLCCRYIQICRSWTTKPIYVIMGGNDSRLVYKALGANYVIYSKKDDVSFLLP